MTGQKTTGWRFNDDQSEFYFEMEVSDKSNSYYFPICNERYRASVTPVLSGDACLDINSYLLRPVTEEELNTTTHSRNFWIVSKDSVWSATGNSLKQKMDRNEKVTVRGGVLWHEVIRENTEQGLTSRITNFSPSTDDPVELMRVTITNNSDQDREIDGILAIPIYGRSADNIRDHHHVTSLLNRIELAEFGVRVHPTLSFDERGHVHNHLIYQIYGSDINGHAPVKQIPVMDDFIGQGQLDWPDYVILASEPSCDDKDIHGRHAFAGMRFESTTLSPHESTSYYVVMGIDNTIIDSSRFLGEDNFSRLLQMTKDHWLKKVSDLRFHTGSETFNRWIRWVTLQPVLRRIYGNSFLPHHDYGRGGRGWRDLWQDILSLILIERREVKDMLISNFAGVRMDGSNATIIGNNPGEFKADRNNIPRVWMDHGVWPLYTTKFYIHQTGDLKILLEEQAYFNDQFSHRCKEVNRSFVPSLGTRLKTSEGKVHFATIIEHLLIQNLTSCLNVGMNNNILLEGGDWNDALDMAREYGESVAFTSFFASNLRELAVLLRRIKKDLNKTTISLTQEILLLIDEDLDFDNPNDKQHMLNHYFDVVGDTVSGDFSDFDVAVLADYLDRFAEHMIDHLNNHEVVEVNGHHWYNGYYDNFGDKVEGEHANGIRMTLTGQTFPLLNQIVPEEHVPNLIQSVDRYLFDKSIGGPRLNTDFKEVKLNLGRAFGFAYGHKENGAMFSHMSIMYAYALYENRRAHEGYKIIDAIFNHLQKTEKSLIYPNLPEYINEQGRGMYSYLTGSASWLVYLMCTQVYGIQGNFGDLNIEPKLVKDQFADGIAEVNLTFRGLEISVSFVNEGKKDYGEYLISSYTINGKPYAQQADIKIALQYDEIVELATNNDISIEITLE